MSKRKVIHSEGRAIIAKVFHFLQEEYNFMKGNNFDRCDLSPLANVLNRTAEATGVSERTVSRILKEEKNLPSPSGELTLPTKQVNIEDESSNDERPSTSALPTRTKQAASKRKIDALQEKLIENKIILKRVRSSNVTLQKKVQMLTHVNKQLRERNIKLKRLLLEEKRKNRKDQRNVMSCDSNIKEEPDNDQNSGIETLVVKIEPPEDEMSS